MDLSERGASTRRHPWETVRAEFFLRLLDAWAPADAVDVLDVGAGDSWFGTELATQRPGLRVVCWDSAYTDEDLRDPPPGIERRREPPEGTFDIVLMLDVLEHIEDPSQFLEADVMPRTGPGTLLIASVPAHQRLYGSHDRALGHYRRYRPDDFLHLLDGAAPVAADGPLFVSLTAPRAVQVAIERRVDPDRVADAGVGDWQLGRVATAAVAGALRADAMVCRWCGDLGIPLRGLSHWAVAVVPSEVGA